MIDTCSDIERRHPDDDHRFRIEHAGVTGADQWHRLAELGAVAVVQPSVSSSTSGRAPAVCASMTTTGLRSPAWQKRA